MYNYELQKSADQLIKGIFGVKPGETVVMTIDTLSSEKVVWAIASRVFAP